MNGNPHEQSMLLEANIADDEPANLMIELCP
jgi:hypothetical protein